MINWNFREKIIYHEEEITQDSRKFEILVEAYLKDQYPLENWKLTKATRDGNKDLESVCEFSGTSMWAEVKYTIHTDKNISSRKYDSTLVSSIFEKNLIKIFFISNTSMGSNLIDRIKKFYYISTIKKIAFVDGYALAYWVKRNSGIEEKFFQSPLNYSISKKPRVRLRSVLLLCKSDSYTIDCVLDEAEVYPLYLSKNYVLEGEFVAHGFHDIPLSLYCNGKLLYNETVAPEITTFSLNLSELDETFNINTEYSLDLYYILNNKRIDCGNYKLRFSFTGKYFTNQIQCYQQIKNGIKASYKKIYNIYGPHGTGKSWLLRNIKNDQLKKITDQQKIIYINFNGQMSDVADICRLIFTLAFNFYDLSISADAINCYCHEKNIANSFYNHKNIECLIHALHNEDYSTIQNILVGSIFSRTERIFETQRSFAYERIYFIDHINLLNETNYYIFEAIVKAFDPLQNVVFVLTGRKEISYPNVENIVLGYIGNNEIIDSINEDIAVAIDNLNEIVPTKHYLKYPGLLQLFIKEIVNFKSLGEIKQFYINNFLHDAVQYEKGFFPFDNIMLLLICIMKEGIPFELLQKMNFDQLKKLLNKEVVVQKKGYVYPNFERWNKDIPSKIIDKYKKSVVLHFQKFMVQDSTRKEFYQCSLMQYYPQYYNEYFDSIFNFIREEFKKNKYSKVVFLCESLIKRTAYYTGNHKKLDTIKYFLVFSYMHCDASKRAQELFGEITQNYQMKLKDNLYFEAESQVIDAKYWNFTDFKVLPKYINTFRKNWKDSENNILPLKTRPYLTATNRMMVTYLALDNIKLANRWLKKNIRLAKEFNAKEHLGYTYMDYAKGIYHLNLESALKYLELADVCFELPSEYRRHLDCQCEIQYVKLLLGRGNISQLLLAQEALFENQYWIQYYKCHLKLAVIYILKGKRKEALQHLLEAEAATTMKNSERIKYLCSMIGTFLYKEPLPYTNSALDGTSYQKIIENMHLNFKQTSATVYNIKKDSPLYNLDPRVW